MRFDRFTLKAQEAFGLAQEIMTEYGHNQLDTEHLLLALLRQRDGLTGQILDQLKVNPQTIVEKTESILERGAKVAYGAQVGQVYITPRAKRVLDMASGEAQRLHDEYIGVEHLLWAVVSQRGDPAAQVMREAGVDEERVYQALRSIRGSQRVTDPQAESKYQVLQKYSRDLTELARTGRLDPVIGRDDEIRRVMQVLSRRTKNNPVLIGEPGVGKTAIVEGLAQKIVEGDVPEQLRDRRVLALDLGSMVAGTKFRGEFEERMKAVMDEIRGASGEIVLFIDELHTVVGAGAAEGAIDASNMLKPALARGEMQTIGATTLDEYREHIEKDAALERRFQPVYVDEPSVEDTIQMLRALRDRYEAHHQLKIDDSALVAAADLSDRYISDRFLPDKAIDLVDEAAAKVRIQIYSMPDELKQMTERLNKLRAEEEQLGQNRDYERAAEMRAEVLRLEQELDEKRTKWLLEKNLDETVDEEDVAELVSQWTGVPVSRMVEAEAEKLVHMEERLHERVIGQEPAIVAISNAIRRARAGLKDPNRPIGSFIFLGPTGVGKTELARTLAEFLFDDETAMVRIDMSEYMEKHTISRLIGAPPGYVGFEEGGQITEAVRRRPYQVILFDEIEKAHPDVFNVLLQILEDGRLTDGHGRTVDFRNTVVIMTSNVGTQYIQKIAAPLGFVTALSQTEQKAETTMPAMMEAELKRTFRPEFLNRVDEIIVFESLTKGEIKQIVDLQLAGLLDRANELGIELELTEAAKNWLAETGYEPQYGARPLRRVIQRNLENPLSMKVLSGELREGDHVRVEVVDNRINLVKSEDKAEKQPSETVSQSV